MISWGNRRELNFTKEEAKAIAGELVEELREEESGSIRDFVGILLNMGYDGFMDFRYRDLYPIASEAFHRAKAEGIEFCELDGNGGKKMIYPPIRHSFIVNNKSAEIKCPRCGSANTARYIYGQKMPTKEELTCYPTCTAAGHLKEKIDSGKVILRRSEEETVRANGVKMRNSPRRVCRECGKRFKKDPVYISPDGNLVADYRDVVVEVSFRIGVFSEKSRGITITRNENGASVRIQRMPCGKETEPRRITPDKWEKLVGRLYGWVDLQDWESEYLDSAVFDGEEWELKVTLTDGNSIEYYGCNAYPPKWADLIKALNNFACFGYRMKNNQKGKEEENLARAAG